MGQNMGMAQRRKKVLRSKAMLRVWPKTTRVCRRLLRGTERGAKWMLDELIS